MTVQYLNRVYRNRYKVEEEIMGGEYEYSFIGTDLITKDKVHIRIIPIDFEHPDLIEQSHHFVFKEICLLQRLNHPGLPVFLESYSGKEENVIITKYIDGEPISKKLELNQTFSEAEVYAFLTQLLAILDYLHSQTPPVIYKDLQPKSIFLDSAGNVFLTKYEEARMFKPDKIKDTIIRASRGYSPPEQAFGKGQLDPRSDIYAVGMVVFQMLTGKDPTKAPLILPKISHLRPEIFPLWTSVVSRATNIKVDKRYASVRELAADILPNVKFMSERNHEEQCRRADEGVQKNQPLGVRLVRTLRGHGDYIGRIAWSPDGRILASPSADKTIRLWNVETGKLIHQLEGHTGCVYSVAFNRTGQLLASGGMGKPGLILWNADTGQKLRAFDFAVTCGVAFNEDGTLLASAGSDGILHLIHINSGKVQQIKVKSSSYGIKIDNTFHRVRGWIKSVSFDPSGRLIACGDEERAVTFWEASNGRPFLTARGHMGDVIAVTFNPDGSTVFSASRDRTIREWALENGKLLNTIEGHTGAVQCLGLSPDGLLMASKAGTGDNTVRIWNRQTREEIVAISEPGSNLWSPGLAFHPCHSYIIATVGSDIDIPEDVPIVNRPFEIESFIFGN